MEPTTTSSSAPPPSGGFLPPGAMDFSTTGIRWVDFLIDAAVVTGLVIAGFYAFYTIHLKPLLAKIAKNAAVAADMTANSHGASSTPNLRDDMDAKHQALFEQNQTVIANQKLQGDLIEGIARNQIRHDKELARIQETQTEDRRVINRLREALDEMKSHHKKAEDP